MTTYWKNLPQRIRDTIGLLGVVGAFGLAAFTLGGATASTAEEIKSLPFRMDTLEMRQAEIDSIVHDLSDDVSKVACVTEKQVLNEDPIVCLTER